MSLIAPDCAPGIVTSPLLEHFRIQETPRKYRCHMRALYEVLVKKQIVEHLSNKDRRQRLGRHDSVWRTSVRRTEVYLPGVHLPPRSTILWTACEDSNDTPHTSSLQCASTRSNEDNHCTLVVTRPPARIFTGGYGCLSAMANAPRRYYQNQILSKPRTSAIQFRDVLSQL